MIYKYFGNTLCKISVLGQGATGAGSNAVTTCDLIKRRVDTLRYGIDLGMTLIDTAESYEGGHSEEIVGRAINGIRDKVFIASKFASRNNSYDGVLKSIDGSLKRLKTDYIDLYQIQWPNPNIPISETMDALSRLIEEGKIRYAGVCNFTLEEMRKAGSNFAKNKIVSVQAEYNLYNRYIESEILPYCSVNGVTVIAYSPLNQGNLKSYDIGNEVLESLSNKYDVTVPQIILNWLVSHNPVIILTRSMNAAHIYDNAHATDFHMETSDIESINEVFKNEPTSVLPSRIRVLNSDVDDTHPIYTRLEDAIRNSLDMTPSPMDIAGEISKGDFLKPVELRYSSDRTGEFEYELIHGRNRYWGWVIAKGDTPIPAFIIK